MITLILPLIALAGHVTQEQAAQKAAQFLSSRADAYARGTGNERPALQLTPVNMGANYHVFNVDGGDGFVIVSSDDRTTPILGYADKGSLKPDSLPENVCSWLQTYSAQLEWIDSHPEARLSRQASLFPAKEPIVTSHWDQAAPYNYLCPTYGNLACMTGCVATALAQIMNYHKYPAQSQRIPAYTTETLSIKVSAKQATRIDWRNMADNYTAKSTSMENTAVSTLMMLVGAALKMDYSPYNSGAYSSDVVPALVDYFSYDTSAKRVSRLFYTIDEWESMIYQELEENRPVYYSGVSIGGGHAFVIDGYENGYFHVNWGWSGISDGYFLLDLVDPEDYSGSGAGIGGYGYSMEQSAVIGIRPSQGTVASEPCMTVREMTVPGSTTYTRQNGGSFSNVMVKASAYNEESGTITFDMGFGVYDESGRRVYEYYVGNKSCGSYEGVFVTPDAMSFGRGWSDGTYTIRAISRPTGSNTWQDNIGSEKHSVKAVIRGNTLTLAERKANLSGSVSVNGTLRMGKEVTIEGYISNSGDDFSDYLYVFIGQTFAGGRFFEVKSGSSATFSLRSILDAAGSKTIELCKDMYGGNIVAQTTVTVAESPSANLSITSSFPDIVNNRLSKATLKGSISINNNLRETYDDEIIVGLFKMISGTTQAKLCQERRYDLNLGGYRSKTIDLAFDGMEQDCRYLLLVYYISKGEQTEGLRTSIFEVDEAAVELFTVTQVRLPDEHYYRGMAGTVDVTVRNDGNVENGSLYLWIDQEEAGTISFNSLMAREERTFSATIVPTHTGSCRLTVTTDADGREVAGSTTLFVEEPEMKLTVTAMELLTEEPTIGMPVEVKFSVSNDGLSSDGMLYVFVNGQKVYDVKVELQPGSTGEYTINYVPEEAGDYLIQLAADEAGSKLLGPSVTFRVTVQDAEQSEAVITPLTDVMKVGQVARFSVSIRNAGSKTAGPFYVFFTDSLVATLNEHISPRQQKTLSFELTPTRSGHNQLLKITTDTEGRDLIGFLNLSVGDLKHQFTVTDIYLITPEFDFEQAVKGFFDVANWGDYPETTLYLHLADSLVQSIPVYIPVGSGDTVQYEFSFMPTRAGKNLQLYISADRAGRDVLCSSTVTIHQPSGIVLPTADDVRLTIYAVNGTRMGHCPASQLHQMLITLPEGIYMVRSQQGDTWKIRH